MYLALLQGSLPGPSSLAGATEHHYPPRQPPTSRNLETSRNVPKTTRTYVLRWGIRSPKTPSARRARFSHCDETPCLGRLGLCLIRPTVQRSRQQYSHRNIPKQETWRPACCFFWNSCCVSFSAAPKTQPKMYVDAGEASNPVEEQEMSCFGGFPA